MPIATLSNRSNKKRTLRDSAIKKMKLRPSEEATIIRHVLDLDMRGFRLPRPW